MSPKTKLPLLLIRVKFLERPAFNGLKRVPSPSTGI
jgi:hypothetical protein